MPCQIFSRRSSGKLPSWPFPKLRVSFGDYIYGLWRNYGRLFEGGRCHFCRNVLRSRAAIVIALFQPTTFCPDLYQLLSDAARYQPHTDGAVHTVPLRQPPATHEQASRGRFPFVPASTELSSRDRKKLEREKTYLLQFRHGFS